MLYIQQLRAVAVRNLENYEIEPEQGLNFFYGPNASGKTSVLETVYLLSRAKSFRSKRIKEVVTRGEQTLQVMADGYKGNNQFVTGIEKGHGLTRLKFDGEAVQTASEQAYNLPVFILTPEYSTLFSGTPKDRRHWLDWSLFHVEHDYLQTWKSYHRALRHRNALIKSERSCNPQEMQGWEVLMAEEANKIDRMRQDYVNEINKKMNRDHMPLVMEGEAKISYQQGNEVDISLEQQLVNSREKDARRGFTSLGPHRSEINFNYDDFAVAKHLSRGQTKLYRAALVSAQIENLKKKGVHSILLIDDLDAELDEESSNNMLQLIQGLNSQTFVSSLSKNIWEKTANTMNGLFHVEHGKVKKMLQ